MIKATRHVVRRTTQALAKTKRFYEIHLGSYHAIEHDILYYRQSTLGDIGEFAYHVRIYSPTDILGAPDAAGRTRLDGVAVLQGNPGQVEGTDLRYRPPVRPRESCAHYDAAGAPVPASFTFRGSADDLVFATHPVAPLEARDFMIENRPSIYLGRLINAFGHIITETMSRFWIFDAHEPRNFNLVFHGMKPKDFPGWMRELLELAGLPLENVSVYDSPTILKNVIIPRQGMILHAALGRNIPI
jgi:hypothetical protein